MTTAEQGRVTTEIHVPLEDGAPSLNDEIIQQALPDWKKSSREEYGLEGYVHNLTTFSRDFDETKASLTIGRNNKNGSIDVGIEITNGIPLSTSFSILETESLVANPFEKNLSFQGYRGAANEQIEIYNSGFIQFFGAAPDSNIATSATFLPKSSIHKQ